MLDLYSKKTISILVTMASKALPVMRLTTVTDAFLTHALGLTMAAQVMEHLKLNQLKVCSLKAKYAQMIFNYVTPTSGKVKKTREDTKYYLAFPFKILRKAFQPATSACIQPFLMIKYLRLKS